METILFIDRNIPEHELFVSGLKSNIQIKSEIELDNQNDFSSVERIGWVWHNNSSSIPFGFTKSNYKYFTPEIINYLSKYINKLQVDLITCSLDSPEFIEELNLIQKILPNITFNYSNSLTGNSPQGNWILESSNQDISQIYFTEKINQYKHVFGFPVSIQYFTGSTVGAITTFTLDTDFSTSTWTSQQDITYSNNTNQLIIDGNNKTVTIDTVNFTGLFYAGNTFTGTDKPTIFKNFNFLSNVNIECALSRITGAVQFQNCTLNLYGNIINEGGGLCYNNTDGSGLNVRLTNCTTIIFGKIGNNAGPLIGYIALNSGNVYYLENCLSVISDNNSSFLSPPYTLSSGAGAFVGSGVSNTVTINSSYCIFNGTMSNGSGIIGGKFLGSSGVLTFNKFYAVTNITYAPIGSGPTDVASSAYILSSYSGSSAFSSSSLSNVNILNLGQNLINIYCTSSIFTSLAGLSLYTDYPSFSSSANTPSARIGEYTYTINYSGSDKTFYSFNSSPIISWVYNLTSDPSTLQGISQLSSFTIENQYYSIYPFTPNSIPPEILVGNGTIITYSSSDPSVATVNSTTGEITMRNSGTVTIIATLVGTSQYVQGSSSTQFIIYGSNNNKKYSKKYLIKKINKLFDSGIIDEATKNKLLEYIELKKYKKIIKFLKKLKEQNFYKSLNGTNNIMW